MGGTRGCLKRPPPEALLAPYPGPFAPFFLEWSRTYLPRTHRVVVFHLAPNIRSCSSSHLGFGRRSNPTSQSDRFKMTVVVPWLTLQGQPVRCHILSSRLASSSAKRDVDLSRCSRSLDSNRTRSHYVWPDEIQCFTAFLDDLFAPLNPESLRFLSLRALHLFHSVSIT